MANIESVKLPNGSEYNIKDAISGYALQSQMSVTDGTGADADKTTIQLKSGTSATVLKTHQNISALQPKTMSSAVTVKGVSKTTVESAISALSYGMLTRKMIVVSDSYGYNDRVDASGHTFPELIEDFTGIDVISKSVQGSGFIGGSGLSWEVRWEHILLDDTSGYGDLDKITDILFVGGANDIGQTASSIKTAIASCASGVASTFPNAKVWVAHPGIVFTAASLPQRIATSLDVYRNYSLEVGWNYISNSEYILNTTDLLSTDHIHPNTSGVHNLGVALSQGVTQGYCDIHYKYTPTASSVKTGGTMGTLEFKSDNGVVQLHATATSVATFTGSGSINAGDKLCELSSTSIMSSGTGLPVMIVADSATMTPGFLWIDTYSSDGTKAILNVGPMVGTSVPFSAKCQILLMSGMLVADGSF